MHKLLFIIITTTLFFTSVSAQKKQKHTEDAERQIYISALLNIDSEEIIIKERRASLRFNSTDSVITFSTTKLPRNSSNFGFAIQIENQNKVYQEVSLTRLNHSKENFLTFTVIEQDTIITRGNILSIWDIKTRFEIGKYLLPKNSKINFGIGLAAAPGFYYYDITPRVSNSFPIFNWNANVDLTLVPAASFKLTNNLSIAVKVIPSLWTIEWNRERTENPILTRRQRVITTTESSFFDKSTVTNIQLKFKIGTAKVQNNRKVRKRKLKRRRK